MSVRRVGLIINPVAGMGGKVGLKGTDGFEVYQQAVALGAQPEAGLKAMKALEGVSSGNLGFELLLCNGAMGEEICLPAFEEHATVYKVYDGQTSKPEDTVFAVEKFIENRVDLILFAGGDGTARLISKVIQEHYGESVRDQAPVCLGIPAGVKVQSSVFAKTPREAGDILTDYIHGRYLEYVLGEVVDLDESAYRRGLVSTKFHGVMKVPSVAHKMQSKKSRSSNEEKVDQMMIASDIVSRMEAGVLYFIGPGSTTMCIKEKLELKGTLIGVDAVRNGKLIASDLTESEILKLSKLGPSKAIITPIGGQGFLFGRGNHQFSKDVLTELGFRNFIIVATQNKIGGLPNRQFFVDTGSDELDHLIKGYTRVVTGIREETIVKIS